MTPIAKIVALAMLVAPVALSAQDAPDDATNGSQVEAKKDKKKDKEKDDDSDDARAAFFRRALETAHGLGVVDCMDCKIETE